MCLMVVSQPGARRVFLLPKANPVTGFIIQQRIKDMTDQNQPRLTAKKIYVKDISFESPSSPGIFLQNAMQPEIDMNLNINNTQIDQEGNFHEAVLQITVTAKHEGKTLFLVEIHQAGVFEVYPEDQEHKELILQVACPNMLLPFAREELASVVTKGGFPQLLISPINFEPIYRENQARLEQAAEGVH